jgi:hypothetical protein
MFRFVALFALVAVAFAEPEADPQFVTNYHHLGVHTVVKPVVPVVNYASHVINPVVYKTAPVVTYKHEVVDPHFTEGMTADGVPEKTASVKIAEKQHEIAQVVEESKKVYGSVFPIAAEPKYPYMYHGVPSVYSHPAVYSPSVYSAYVPTVAGHVIGKREAEGEADPALFYNSAYTGYPYTAGVTGYPYTAGVTGYTYPSVYNSAVTGYPTTYGYPYAYNSAVKHVIGKREAESDSQVYSRYWSSPYQYQSAYYKPAYYSGYSGVYGHQRGYYGGYGR